MTYIEKSIIIPPMDQQNIEEYIRCRTCGEYVPKRNAVSDVFCSNLCTRKYTKCVNCGTYFIKNSTMEGDLCSPECREKNDYIPDEDFMKRIQGAVT